MKSPPNDCPPNTDTSGAGQSLRFRTASLAASAVLCIAVSLCYWLQPDWLAPVTLVPAWCWLLPAFVLTVFGISRRHKLWSLAVLTLWTAYTAVLVEEAKSLVRGKTRPAAERNAAPEAARGIRVVSLNCAAASSRAAAEVAKWKPHIVLLQESPSREHLKLLAGELFGADGSFLYGGDTSILARGTIQPRSIDTGSHFVHATIELPSGVKTDVVSVRLNPPVFRLDFWAPGFWIDHRNNRIKHRRQILDVIERIGTITTPVIVGGDFNAPPNDAALAPLRETFFDTFREAGHGWGNTGTNELPLFRVDQVWASRHFRAESATAQKTIHSDHRMVVCDLVLR